jgi:hypothetical protein
MTSESFNKSAQGIITIVESRSSELADDLAILKGWGFTVENSGEKPFGESGTVRPFADVKLPEGWRSFGGFDPDKSMSYMDGNGALRINLTHRSAPEGRIPESYGLSFYDRFSLSPVVTEGKNGRDISYDRSVLKDNKTGTEIEVGPGMGLNAESDITFAANGNLWASTLLDVFAPGTGNDRAERKKALAELWNQDIKLDAPTAETLRVLVLDAVYQEQIADLQKKRGKLNPGLG